MQSFRGAESGLDILEDDLKLDREQIENCVLQLHLYNRKICI